MGLARKTIIFATSDGLILQPQPGSEYHQVLRLDFNRISIAPQAKPGSDDYKEQPYLESHGIIGLLAIASFHFLLCITRREEKAQIFGKPIYVIQDIAILPLSSHAEASRAISQARGNVQEANASDESEAPSSGLGDTDDDSLEDGSFDNSSVGHPSESTSLPSPTTKASAKAGNETGVVRQVLERNSQYSRFASQWFSRTGSGLYNKRAEEKSTEIMPQPDHRDRVPRTSTSRSKSHKDSSLTGESATVPDQSVSDDARPEEMGAQQAAIELLPKILRTTKLFLSSSSFYFSYAMNITKNFGSASTGSLKDMSPGSLEQQFFWNRYLAVPFFDAGFPLAVMPIMQGFIGQQPFIVKMTSSNQPRSEALEPVSEDQEIEGVGPSSDQVLQDKDGPQPFLLTLISRKSSKRSGLRYLRRGIDDAGNCANSVETEQILSSPTWKTSECIRSFVQVRGSIPLYFSQSPYAIKPAPIRRQSPEMNQNSFDRHFQCLQRRYGNIQIVLLVDRQGGEKEIGEEYQRTTTSYNATPDVPELDFEWFDFHRECRAMKFENVKKLVSSMEDTMVAFGDTEIEGHTTKHRQSGIIRTNCMDCLDRTNVVQSAFAQHMLQKTLEKDGFSIDFVHDLGTQWFNALWADNGDAISRQYASTAALKGDYTRTRKRNYRGALTDMGLTLTRYYNNIVNDYFLQAVIDVLLGNVTSRIFEDFEATMIGVDPGISVDKIRKNAIDTCAKIVIQHPEEELACGWAMLAPAQTNTLRTLPFEEAILLLTSQAVYGCKFDWNTEKVASFERVDLRSIIKIYYGVYITSTLTEGQMNEDSNVGLVISYTPGTDSIKRVNTRSLRLSDNLVGGDENDKGKEENGALSWLRARTQAPKSSQSMAMKVIPKRSPSEEKIDSCPRDTAKEISHEIQRAVCNLIVDGHKSELDLLEQADIISLADARRRTGYLEQIGHSIKKLLWT